MATLENTFDMLKGDNKSMSHPYEFIHSFTCVATQ